MSEATMRCEVHKTAPIGLIELVGALRLDDTPRLREAVLKVMAAGPDAIVLDLAGLNDLDDLSVSMFRTLGRTVAAAADGELILAAAAPSTRDTLRRGAPLFVRTFDSCGQALEAAARAPARRRVARQLPADPYAGRTARRTLDEVCTRWRMNELREPALVIVTELVTNAIDHVGTPIELCVTVRCGVLRIEVSDHSDELPGACGISPDVEYGHGLRLVDRLACQWGATTTAWGKTIWADLVVNDSQRARSRRAQADRD